MPSDTMSESFVSEKPVISFEALEIEDVKETLSLIFRRTTELKDTPAC